MDPVFKSVQDMYQLLSEFKIQAELSNGNLEKELKLLLASALRRQNDQRTRRYISVSDKQFNRVPIDLLALEILTPSAIAEPAFWIELKSTFKQAGMRASQKLAIRTLSQVKEYIGRLRETNWTEANQASADPHAIDAFRRTLLTKPIYIVHFFNLTPTGDSGLPPLILKKFPQCSPVDTDKVCRAYDSSEEHIIALERENMSSVDPEVRRTISSKTSQIRDYIRSDKDHVLALQQKLSGPELKLAARRALEREMHDRVVAMEMRKLCAESKVIRDTSTALEAVVAKFELT